MSRHEELIERAQANDREAMELLVSENAGLIWSVARRFAGRGTEMEDLYQLGCLGFIKAVSGFDLQYGTQFSTYAVPKIAGEIRRFLRDDGLVKVSRTIKENGYKVKMARQAFQMEHGREPTFQEVAMYTKLPQEEVVLAMEASVPVESIHTAFLQSDGSETYLLDRIAVAGTAGNGGGAVRSGCEEDPEKEALLNHILLKQLLQELDEREKELIALRYFQDKTQVQKILTV